MRGFKRSSYEAKPWKTLGSNPGQGCRAWGCTTQGRLSHCTLEMWEERTQRLAGKCGESGRQVVGGTPGTIRV